MALNVPPGGLNISLQTLKDVNKCIICQKNNDKMENLQVMKKEGKVLSIAQVVERRVIGRYCQ